MITFTDEELHFAIANHPDFPKVWKHLSRAIQIETHRLRVQHVINLGDRAGMVQWKSEGYFVSEAASVRELVEAMFANCTFEGR